ncbi:hypothetical protein ACIRBX_11975 [Kitasatospora sp. NPDC096147]|uniref:hypothetical protein n=1 Tax=Kitasatospora sp. NPDC096147 TaxID=3364093 RepID=UPI0037F6BF52
MLIRALLARPGRSALLAELDASTEWGTTEHLLARVSDALELSNFLFIKANSTSSSGIDVPQPLPRPGAEAPAAPEQEFATGAELSAFMTQINTH